ncbi:MAG: hypothetical protein GOU99_03130 [Candidatus Altiarchaeota archaeon]|nr:hypothetical protein [Candidatus Altiarchaeota archaeon]
MLLIHGTQDNIVPLEQSWLMHEKLDELGIQNQLVIVQSNHLIGIEEPAVLSIIKNYFQVFG